MVPLEVRLVTPILIVLLSGPDSAQSRGLSCLEPEPPFLGKINKQREPDLYKFARAEFQTYLEKLEQHLRCLEH